MTKLIPTIAILLFTGLSGRAQLESQTAKLKYFEAGLAGVHNDLMDPILASASLHLGTIVSPSFSYGALLSGYTALAKTRNTAPSTDYDYYSPRGGRLGFFVRPAIDEANKLALQIKLAVGVAYQTGVMELRADDSALEYAGGVDLSYRFSLNKTNSLAVFLGADMAVFDYRAADVKERMFRYSAGVKYQIKYKKAQNSNS